jgi:hypothetical protein
MRGCTWWIDYGRISALGLYAVSPPEGHWNVTSQCLRDVLDLLPDIAGNVTNKLQFSPLLIR